MFHCNDHSSKQQQQQHKKKKAKATASDPMSDTDLLRQHDVAFGDEIPAAGEVEGREEQEEGEMDAGDTVNVHGGPNPQPEVLFSPLSPPLGFLM